MTVEWSHNTCRVPTIGKYIALSHCQWSTSLCRILQSRIGQKHPCHGHNIAFGRRSYYPTFMRRLCLYEPLVLVAQAAAYVHTQYTLYMRQLQIGSLSSSRTTHQKSWRPGVRRIYESRYCIRGQAHTIIRLEEFFWLRTNFRFWTSTTDCGQHERLLVFRFICRGLIVVRIFIIVALPLYFVRYSVDNLCPMSRGNQASSALMRQRSRNDEAWFERAPVAPSPQILDRVLNSRWSSFHKHRLTTLMINHPYPQ